MKLALGQAFHLLCILATEGTRSQRIAPIPRVLPLLTPKNRTAAARGTLVQEFAVAHTVGQPVSSKTVTTRPIPSSGNVAVLPIAPEKVAVKAEAKRVHYVDAIAEGTDGWLDAFLVIYWGSVLIAIVAFLASATQEERMTPRAEEKEAEEQEEVGPRPSVYRRMTTAMPILFDDVPLPPRTINLDANLWTLNLCTAVGQATDARNRKLSPLLTFCAAFTMGCLQVFTLALIVYDIDPDATPYTVHPSAPWKTSAVTVNCMKFVMVFFLAMSVVEEAGNCLDNFFSAMGVDGDHLNAPRLLVFVIPIFHYLVTLFVVLAGVSVILSCQAVPDILYNSMAIVFITQVDELLWMFSKRCFDIQATWEIAIPRESKVPTVHLLKKCVILFPMVWGFSLLGRAWYRGMMPALFASTTMRHG